MQRDETGRRFGELHASFLLGKGSAPGFDELVAALRTRDPGYAPLRFLLDERAFWERTQPALVKSSDFPVLSDQGATGVLRVSVVRQYVGRGSVLVSVVDNARRKVFGQRYVDGEYDQLEWEVVRFAEETLQAFRRAASAVSRPGGPLPREATLAEVFAREGATRVGTIPP